MKTFFSFLAGFAVCAALVVAAVVYEMWDSSR